jgi:hypothetical protein
MFKRMGSLICQIDTLEDDGQLLAVFASIETELIATKHCKSFNSQKNVAPDTDPGPIFRQALHPETALC